MLKKIFKIIIPITLISIISFIAYNSYKNAQKTTSSPITIIPTNAALIIQLNDVKNINRTIESARILNKLKNIKKVNIVIQQIKDLNNLLVLNKEIFTANNLFISFHKVSANKSSAMFSLTFEKNKDTNEEDIAMLFSNNITASQYDKQSIYFSPESNNYFSFKKDIMFFSKNKMLLEDAIRTSHENTEDLFFENSFRSSYNTINESAEINLMINYNNLIDLSKTFMKSGSHYSNISGWTSLDIKVKNDVILANGINSTNEAIKNFADVVNTQKKQEIKIINIIPESTTSLLAISFNKPKKLYEGKNKILQHNNEFWNWDKKRESIEDSTNIKYNEFIDEIDNEAGIFNTSPQLDYSNSYSYFKTKESIIATSLLQGMIISHSQYKDYRINKIIDPEFVTNLFGNILNAKTPFFTTIDDYFIFGTSNASIEYIIDKYTAKKTFNKNIAFKEMNSYIEDQASIFFYLNPGKTAETLKHRLIDTSNLSYHIDSLNKFTAFTIQASSGRNGLLNNMCLLYSHKYKEPLEEKWYYSLDTNAITQPYFIDDHTTKQKLILIQDKSNTLSAINAEGKIKWEIELENRILGDINYAYAFKNSYKQALFNTRDKLYLVDVMGRIADGFPKNLPHNTSIGHALFDYNKNKEYRILITGEDNMLYNYKLNKGLLKENKGWSYKKENDLINQTPIHFTINQNDYILNSTNNTSTRLLHLRGHNRVVLDGQHTFSNKIKISAEGDMYAITNKGKLWRTTNIDKDHADIELLDIPIIDTNSIILAYKSGYYIGSEKSLLYVNQMNDETLNINLDTKIETISIHNEYIAVTTKFNLYLMKDNKFLEGFPIESSGFFNISDIDKNGKANIINLYNGVIYNYEISE